MARLAALETGGNLKDFFMQMNQEKTVGSALERRFDMSVSLAGIDQQVEQRLKHLARTVKMAGFRPGKVPFKMVAQQYGPQTRSEAIGEAVEKAFGDKVREQKMRVAGYPRIEPRDSADKTQIEFTAVFEVYPEIKLADISDRELENPVLAVGDTEIDKTIEVLRKQRTTYEDAGRTAASGDRVVIDFIGRRDGEPFQGGQGTDFAMLLGGGQMLPDFEAAVSGMAAAQTKHFDLTFPAEYQAKDLAGQTV